MEKIQWTQSLSIGQPAIDDQHRRLIQLVDAVPDFGNPADGSLLHELIDYVSRHFAAEEAFMQRVGYPNLVEHKIVHKSLQRMLMTHKANFDAGKLDVRQFKEFVFRWISEHIMVEDKAIGRWVDTLQRGPPRR
jgi:hemerythrin